MQFFDWMCIFMKRMVALLAAVLVIFYAVGVCAANPSSLGANASSTAWDLIVVRKPESKNSATLKRTYGITGTGKNGVKVAYYKYSGGVYSAIKNSDGTMAQTTVGTAGVFYKQVSLSEGGNKFAVRAEAPNGTYQIVYFDINVLDAEVMSNVSGFSNGIQSLYNGWMN